MHYLRVLRNDTLDVTPHAGPGSPRWRERGDLTYDAAHDRVKRYRGSASSHSCVDCHGPAEDWAYQHFAADPLFDELGRPFSDDLNDYAPMCRSCHRAFDMSVSHRQQGGDHLTIVTIQEAALFAGVSVATVRAWVDRGVLSPVRKGVRPLLYRYDEVAQAQRLTRSKAWSQRHAQAVEKWELLLTAV